MQVWKGQQLLLMIVLKCQGGNCPHWSAFEEISDELHERTPQTHVCNLRKCWKTEKRKCLSCNALGLSGQNIQHCFSSIWNFLINPCLNIWLSQNFCLTWISRIHHFRFCDAIHRVGQKQTALSSMATDLRPSLNLEWFLPDFEYGIVNPKMMYTMVHSMFEACARNFKKNKGEQ